MRDKSIFVYDIRYITSHLSIQNFSLRFDNFNKRIEYLIISCLIRFEFNISNDSIVPNMWDSSEHWTQLSVLIVISGIIFVSKENLAIDRTIWANKQITQELFRLMNAELSETTEKCIIRNLENRYLRTALHPELSNRSYGHFVRQYEDINCNDRCLWYNWERTDRSLRSVLFRLRLRLYVAVDWMAGKLLWDGEVYCAHRPVDNSRQLAAAE